MAASKKTLSSTMRRAVACARENGGRLTRYAGGFWKTTYDAKVSFGTSTIEALVVRGVADYTLWRERSRGPRFPIEMTLTPEEADVC